MNATDKMQRRNNSTLRYGLFIAIGGMFVYGIYLYSSLQTKTRNFEEKSEKYRQQYDSASAQLQVVYEHKTRLEKSVQDEKKKNKQTIEEFQRKNTELESKFSSEKQELLRRVDSIHQEKSILKNQNDDLLSEISKTNEKLAQIQDDNQKQSQQHNEEYQRFKQEKENEIAQMKDEIANLKRTNEGLSSQLSNAVKQQQNNEAQNQQLVAQQQRIQQQQQNQQPYAGQQGVNVQQHNAGQQPMVGQQQPIGQQLLQQGRLPEFHQIQQRFFPQGNNDQAQQQAQIPQQNQNLNPVHPNVGIQEQQKVQPVVRQMDQAQFHETQNKKQEDVNMQIEPAFGLKQDDKVANQEAEDRKQMEAPLMPDQKADEKENANKVVKEGPLGKGPVNKDADSDNAAEGDKDILSREKKDVNDDAAFQNMNRLHQMGEDGLAQDNPLDKHPNPDIGFLQRQRGAFEQNAGKEQIRAPNLLEDSGKKGPLGNDGVHDNQIPLPKMGGQDDPRNDEQIQVPDGKNIDENGIGLGGDMGDDDIDNDGDDGDNRRNNGIL